MIKKTLEERIAILERAFDDSPDDTELEKEFNKFKRVVGPAGSMMNAANSWYRDYIKPISIDDFSNTKKKNLAYQNALAWASDLEDIARTIRKGLSDYSTKRLNKAIATGDPFAEID